MEKSCIICLSDRGPFNSIEHPIPETLGSPPNFILPKGTVCDKCNNGILSKLDDSLCKEFDTLLFFRGQKNKKGKMPVVRRPNLVGVHEDDGPHYFINDDDKEIIIDPKRQFLLRKKSQGSNRSIETKEWEISGKNVHFKFSHKLYFNKPLFKRALHKIAYEYMAFEKGKEFILDSIFGDCRNFILRGKPIKDILQICRNDIGMYEETSIHSRFTDELANIVVPIKLLGFDFLVQVTNGSDAIDRIHSTLPKLGQDVNRW